ncbi:MAG TPA: GNAT family protein [Bacteroidales bacterium]|nr:GNAT family protein [Bacteroidales bacterium]HPS15609.1 GNAT family protein [Bacteroidales bacterium]
MKGKNISFRAPEPADIDILYKWENDTRIWHLSNTVAPFSHHLLEEYILNAQQDIYAAKQLRLMIVETDNNKTIGCIDLFDFDPSNQRAGVGILISEEYRSKGYASQALEILTDYAFNTLHLHQLFCNITSDNENSLKLFKKFKFEIIGLKKEWILQGKTWKDEYILQLINK